MISLYDDQEKLRDDIRVAFRSYHSVLAVAPCGFGKTVLFCWIAQRMASQGKRIHIYVHRDELLDQVCNTLSAFGVEFGVISPNAKHERHHLAQVASVFTLLRRLDRVDTPDAIIADEAHHCCQGSTWSKIFEHWRTLNPWLYIIGFTATPCRLGGEGLGVDFGGPFEHMVLGPTPRELIDKGRLSDYRIVVPSTSLDFSGMRKVGGEYVRSEMAEFMRKPAIVGDAISHYKKHCDGMPAVAFTVSVEEAKRKAEDFRSAGYQSVSIDGKMDRYLRREIISDYKLGKINVLTSCSLVDEGFDCPGIIASIDLAPTLSLSRNRQRVGRVMRTAPGKDKAIMIDTVGNAGVNGPSGFIPKHGLPDDHIEWSLAGSGVNSRKKNDVPAPRICSYCYGANRAGSQRCRICGELFPVEGRQVDQVDGELTEVEAARARREARIEQGTTKDFQSLVALGKLRGYRSAERWAAAVIAGREKKLNKQRGVA